MDEVSNVFCQQTYEGECELTFQSEGIFYFTSGFVQEGVSFGVTVYVGSPSQKISSDIRVEVEGDHYSSRLLHFINPLENQCKLNFISLLATICI